MNPLTDFAVRWAQTPSDFDVLIAKTMFPTWARIHLPVVSRKSKRAPFETTHTLYNGYHLTEPEGKVIYCHGKECGIENRIWYTRGKTVFIECTACGSTCNFKRVAPDTRSLLGSHGFIATEFPRGQAIKTWTTASEQPPKASKQPRGRARIPHWRSAVSTSATPSLHNTPQQCAPPFLDMSGRTPGQYRGVASSPIHPTLASPTPSLLPPSLPPSLPPQSRSPSLSASPSSSAHRLIIKLPSKSSRQRLLPGPSQMERAQSTPAVMVQEDDDPMPELQMVRPSSLADLTPLHSSTDSRKRRKKTHVRSP